MTSGMEWFLTSENLKGGDSVDVAVQVFLLGVMRVEKRENSLDGNSGKGKNRGLGGERNTCQSGNFPPSRGGI